MRSRIVVTGVGVVSPSGTGKKDFWRGLLEGASNIQSLPWAADSNSRCGSVCRVDGLERLPVHGDISDAALYALAAAQEALHDSGIENSHEDGEIGISLGTASGHSERLFERAVSGDGLFAPTRSPAQIVAETLQLWGPVSTLPVACTAGTSAVVDGILQLGGGRLNAMLVGGTEGLSSVCFSGFASLNVLTSDAVRPFDSDRSGFLVGEGAGVMLLEPLEKAHRRGAQIYAEVLGFGMSADSHHIIHPHPKAAGMTASLRKALEMAHLAPADVDYTNAHGTATLANDRAECIAITQVFAGGNQKPVMNSLKAVLGHTMGAAGAIETIGCLLSMVHHCIPPTWNFKKAAGDCDIDCVPNEPREERVSRVLKMSAGFGGSNCAIVLGTC